MQLIQILLAVSPMLKIYKLQVRVKSKNILGLFHILQLSSFYQNVYAFQDISFIKHIAFQDIYLQFARSCIRHELAKSEKYMVIKNEVCRSANKVQHNRYKFEFLDETSRIRENSIFDASYKIEM